MPCINTLLIPVLPLLVLVNRNRRIRADSRAGAAGNAALADDRRIIALLVDLRAFAQHAFGTKLDTIASLFAALKIDLYDVHICSVLLL